MRLIPFFLILSISLSATAKPWISPGDPLLRSDIQLLSDIGVIKSPVTTWPINWSGIKRDLFEARNLKLGKIENDARQRVLRRCKYETRDGSRKAYGLGGEIGTSFFNSFGDEYQDGVEITGNTDWLGKRFAVNLQAATVFDSDDEKKLRFDGSYAAVVLDNWILSAGAEQRWWGPGWGDSLLIGNNARALPGISLRRNHSKAPQSKMLAWIGPWHLDLFAARLESDRAVDNAIMLGTRFSFKPRSNIEIALSRTSLFGGSENPTNFSAFFSALRGDGEIDGEENAVFSFGVVDARVAVTRDFAIYGQYGETEGAQQDGKLGLLGGDLNLSVLSSKYPGRAYFEIVDTDINNDGVNSYHGDKYQTGYYYRGKAIGYPFIGQSVVIGANLSLSDSEILSLSLRGVELKQDSGVGAPQSDQSFIVIGAGYSLHLLQGNLSGSMELYSEKVELNGADAEKYSLDVVWKRGF